MAMEDQNLKDGKEKEIKGPEEVKETTEEELQYQIDALQAKLAEKQKLSVENAQDTAQKITEKTMSLGDGNLEEAAGVQDQFTNLETEKEKAIKEGEEKMNQTIETTVDKDEANTNEESKSEEVNAENKTEEKKIVDKDLVKIGSVFNFKTSRGDVIEVKVESDIQQTREVRPREFVRVKATQGNLETDVMVSDLIEK